MAGERVTPLWRGLERRLPEGFAGRHQWLWILTADSLPAPDALEQLVERLLTVTDEETHAALQVVGAKQLHAAPDDGDAARVAARDAGAGRPDRLIDVGLSSARSGEVVPTTEPMELDQGQYDGRDAVAAASLHGMLVHAPLFGDLGGFDPTLSGDHAAARFADRAREVGAHVVVAPQARIRRLTPPRREQVHRLGGTLHLPAEQRIGQIRRRLAEAPLLTTPVLWLGGWLAALLRLLGLTAVKAPDAGVGELVASARALLNLRALVHARRFAAEGRRAVLERLRRDERLASTRAARELVRDGRRTSRRLRLSAARVRAERRRSLTAQTVAPPQGDDGAPEAATLAAGSGDGEFDQLASRRSGDRLGLFLLLLGLTALSLLVHRGLLGAEAVVGGAALPVSDTIGEVLAETTSLVATDGLGRLAAANPFDLVLLVLSVLSAGQASAVLVWLTILALPLAALTAWAAAGVVTAAATTRIIAALLWVAVPSLHTALGEGRLGAVIAHILLPLVVRLGVRAAGRRPAAAGPEARGGASSWEHAAGTALLLAAVTAAAPILLLPATLVCVLAALTRGGRTFWLIPLPSLVLAAPMLGTAALTGQNVLGVLFSAPTRLLAADPAPLWQQLLGHARAVDPTAGLSIGSDLDWLPELLSTPHWALRLMLVIGLPLLLLGLIGLLLPGPHAAGPRSAGGRGLAGTLLLTLLVSAAAGLVAVGDDGVELTPAHAAPLVSVMMLCLLLGASRALDGLPRALPRAGSAAGPVLATLLVLAVLASLGSWAAPRVLEGSGSRPALTAMTAEPAAIEAGTVRQLPATAADQGEGPAALRTLVLTSSADGVVGELVSGSGRTLDSARSALTAGDAPLWTEPELLPTWLGGTDGAAVEEPAPGSVAELSPGRARTGQLISALITPGAAEVPALMEELAVGFVVVDGPGDGALAGAVDTAAGLVAVGPTDRGQLWRADLEDAAGLPRAASMSGAATSWARLVDAEGTTLALLPADGGRVDVDLDTLAAPAGGEGLSAGAAAGDVHVQLATAPAAGWSAELDGEALESPAGDSGEGPPQWGQQFRLPEGELSGELVVEHHSVWRAPALIAVAAVLVLVALIAVPLPRRVRLLPVATRGELGDRPAARSEGEA